MRYLRLPISVFLLALFSAPASGMDRYIQYWYWKWTSPPWYVNSQSGDEYLTGNNGAHAVSITKYSNPEKVWVNIVASNQNHGLHDNVYALAHQFDEILYDPYRLNFKDTNTIRSNEDLDYWNTCVSAAAGSPDGRKVATFSEDDRQTNNNYAHACADWLTNTEDSPWPNFEQLSPSGIWDGEATSAVVMEDDDYACAVFPAGYDGDPNDYEGLMAIWTTDGGDNWRSQDRRYIVTPVEAGPYLYNPSICKGTNGSLHVAYVATPTGQVADTIKYCKGSSHGSSWSDSPVTLDYYENAGQPCIACLGDLVLVCWTKSWGNESRIYYRWSTNGGDDWGNQAWEVPLVARRAGGSQQ